MYLGVVGSHIVQHDRVRTGTPVSYPTAEMSLPFLCPICHLTAAATSYVYAPSAFLGQLLDALPPLSHLSFSVSLIFLSLYVCVSLLLSLFFYLASLFLSLFVCCLSLSLCLCLSLSLALSFTFSLSLYAASLFLSMSACCLTMYLSVPVSVSRSLALYISLFLSLSRRFVSDFVCCLPLSIDPSSLPATHPFVSLIM